MRVWLVQGGEPLAIDPGSPRLMRYSMLAAELAHRGHEVVWWTSAFDHYRKQMRGVARQSVSVGGNEYEIVTLRALGYRAHVSLRRMLDQWWTGRDLRRQSRRERSPDVICCGLPTLELAMASRALGRRHGCPVVLDIRDLWPDIFTDVVPERLRPLAKPILGPMERMANRSCESAAAIIGITDEFVQWGVDRAGRDRTDRDLTVPLACVRPETGIVESAFWEGIGIDLERPIVAFAGSFNRNFDFTPVLDCAREWFSQESDVQFVLCGTGPHLEGVRDMAQGLSNVTLPGWVEAPQLASLLQSATVGIAPYEPSSSFLASIPNKVIEYLSHGLPVICSLEQGVAGRLIVNQRCGVTYSPKAKDSVAAALHSVMDDVRSGASMASEAKRVFAENFDSREVYGRLASLLEELSVSSAR